MTTGATEKQRCALLRAAVESLLGPLPPHVTVSLSVHFNGEREGHRDRYLDLIADADERFIPGEHPMLEFVATTISESPADAYRNDAIKLFLSNPQKEAQRDA